MWPIPKRDDRPAYYRCALCSTPQFGWRQLLACRAVTLPRRVNPLKFAGVPQTTETISAASGPKCDILWGHVGELLLLNKFFSDCRYMLNCEDSTRKNCAMVPRWRFFASFLRPVFPASRVQHISDLHCKFLLRPHHVWKYGRHPMCDGWDYARKKRRKKEEETTVQKYNVRICIRPIVTQVCP